MSVSRLTALIILANDVEPLAYGPNAEGKYQGVIGHSKEHPSHPYMPLLSTEFEFNTSEDAVKSMTESITAIRKAVNEQCNSECE